MSYNRRTKDPRYDSIKNGALLSKLHTSIWTCDFNGVRAAIRADADLNQPIPGTSTTPIHMAIVKKNVPILQELIHAGVELNVKGTNQIPLVSAVICGKIEIVKLLLDNGADINARDREVQHDTALHVAALEGNVDIAEFLIDRGLDVNIRNILDQTPLHIALKSGKVEMVQLLLSKGADVNAVSCVHCKVDGEGVKKVSEITALYLASSIGLIEIVDTLIKAGANLEARSSGGCTALFGAVTRGHPKILKMLCTAGANVNAQANSGETPLFCAVQKGYTEIVAELLKVEGINLSIPDDNQQTPLFVAAESGHLEIVKLLIAKGAPVDDDVQLHMPYCSVTPLHIALLKGKESVAEFLIQSGADIHARNVSDGLSAMASACGMLGVSPKLGKLLIEKGGDVNERRNDGTSILHLAALADNDPLKSVKFLVEHGADTDVQNKEKRTPLHEAVDVGNVKIVEYLATKVKQIDPETLSPQTPLHFAVKKGHLKIAEILLDHGANINAQDSKKRTPLHVAVAAKQSEIAKLLLQKRAVVNLKDKEEERTPLFLATKTRDEKLVNLLLQNDADPNIGNKFGIMPIHVASKGGAVNIVKALLEKGAYFDVTGGTKIFKGSPLMFAKKGGNAKIITLLELIEDFFKVVIQKNTQQIKCYVQAGAIVNARNASGRTALHYVVGNGNIDLVNTLLANGADVGSLSNTGNTPLHIAVTNQSMEIVEILLTHAKQLSFLKFNRSINAETTDSGTTALHIAAENNCLDIVQLLIKNGALYNTKNKSGEISSQITSNEEIQDLLNFVEKLFQAVEKDNVDVAMRILENDKSVVNARDSDGGGTPLYWAVSKGYKDVVDLLLDNNADYFLVTNKGTTPLHIAASKGNLEMVKTLVTRVKNECAEKTNDFLDAQTLSGTTALHVASSVNVVKCLLQAGATYNILNREDKTPLQRTANSDVQKLLKLTHQLFKDVKKGSSTVVSTVNGLKVEECRAVLNTQNELGKTLVNVAVANGHVKIASRLLEKSKKFG